MTLSVPSCAVPEFAAHDLQLLLESAASDYWPTAHGVQAVTPDSPSQVPAEQTSGDMACRQSRLTRLRKCLLNKQAVQEPSAAWPYSAAQMEQSEEDVAPVHAVVLPVVRTPSMINIRIKNNNLQQRVGMRVGMRDQ